DWKLPACFGGLRGELEGLHGAMSGSRRFVQVLQLLGEHPMSRVTQAIEACGRDQLHSAEAVIQRTRSLAAVEAARHQTEAHSETPAATRVHVPLPDLSRFDQLLSGPAAGGAVSIFFA
ncbi:MAG: hypothetical protein Q8M47_09695, partial [Devosia sp.]|nr:hypothetical protein [Devosia sp.]